jgi:hypothetical protein
MKIAMYDLEGHLLEVLEGKTYQEIVDLFPKKRGIINTGPLRSAIKGEVNTYGNYQFREVSNSRNFLERIGDVSSLTQQEKAVNKYYKGRYICTYKSITEASIKNKILIDNIAKCTKLSKRTAGGFEWKYAE